MDIEREIERRYRLQVEYLGSDKPVNKVEPLVTVRTSTYQHVDYIEDCIKGVLVQKTTFPFEFIIGEDGSTDGTRTICEEYARNYPDKIRLFNRDRKLTQLYDKKGNFIKRLNGHFTIRSSRGKYMAICEGDDYWTDPYKLQKQVDFLEKNQDYGLVFGNFHCVDSNGTITECSDYFKSMPIKTNINGYMFPEYFENKFVIHYLTVMLRSSYLKNDYYKKNKYGYDVAHLRYILFHAKIYKFDEVFGCYRNTEKSLTKTNSFSKLVKKSYLESFAYFSRLEYKPNDLGKKIALFRRALGLFLSRGFNVNERFFLLSIGARNFPGITIFFDILSRNYCKHLIRGNKT